MVIRYQEQIKNKQSQHRYTRSQIHIHTRRKEVKQHQRYMRVAGCAKARTSTFRKSVHDRIKILDSCSTRMSRFFDESSFVNE